MGKFTDTVKGWISTGLAFGNKNAPILMTGGGITLGWIGAYILWKQSKKAEQVIAKKEADLQSTVDISEDDENGVDGKAVMNTMKARSELSKKEKAIIYLQYCWTAGVIGLASTGLLIFAQKVSLDRLAEMYLLTQFLEDKSKKQDGMIEKLKEKAGLKDGNKAMNDLENDIIDDEYDKDEIIEELRRGGVYEPGSALIIDKVTHVKFRGDIIEITSGIAEFNELLKSRRRKAMKKRLGDAFYSASDMPWGDSSIDEDQYGEVYSTGDLETFLQSIGEIDDSDGLDTRLGELLEFRYFGGGDLLKPTQIMKYKEYLDPTTGYPAVVYLDYTEYLSPSSELLERNPL